ESAKIAGNSSKGKVFPHSRSSRTASPEEGIYIYCNGWQSGGNVYGPGTITSDYGDYDQYLVTTTVIAPDGSRYSTSQAGSDYAAITITSYLPIIPDDGTFTVESVFEG